MSISALNAAALLSAALGLASISLTGEISPLWISLSWSAWLFSFISGRFPGAQAKLRRLETAAVVGMIALLVVDFFVFRNTIFIAITHFLLFFQIVKLAGEKTRKDNLQIFLFSFFQILASCTLSVDAWQAIVLLAFIPTATLALFWNQMERESETGTPRDPAVHRSYRRMATLICALVLPLNVALTVVVFIIFPRVTINVTLPGYNSPRMGYTDQINLTRTGSLEQSAAVALWLAFPHPDDRRLWSGYLRGDTLRVFDGRQWSTASGRVRRFLPDSNGVTFIRPHVPSLRLIQESITLLDTSAHTVFTAGRPIRVVSALPSLQENEEGTLHWISPWHRALHYNLIAEPFVDTETKPVDLALPALPMGRIRVLTREVAGSGPPLLQAQKIESYLRQNYQYSTDFGNQAAANPVDYFLFDRKQGACGHFASAMAVMLRLQKIPSRVVAGYYKGEWNEPARCVVVRERDAHAWVEAYIPGKGWTSFDPTPIPDATSVSQRLVLVHQLNQYWDYLSYQWNRLVIQYDLYSQVNAFETLKSAWWPHWQFRFHRARQIKGTGPEAAAEERGPFPWKKRGSLFSLVLSRSPLSPVGAGHPPMRPSVFTTSFWPGWPAPATPKRRMKRAGNSRSAWRRFPT